ncbi:Protein of unknown function [Gryllus bimaculatus]|nr:Protein of unknown function [Gryllus bimaculatus]
MWHFLYNLKKKNNVNKYKKKKTKLMECEDDICDTNISNNTYQYRCSKPIISNRTYSNAYLSAIHLSAQLCLQMRYIGKSLCY